mmetsp:Transcript_23288/g.40259  ORF Transcript_23288/g.40259 Transcript_23288/m.40259 type:complete len:252 (+) Transcript_23288:163-918(+)
MARADHGGIGQGRVRNCDILQIHRRNPFASRFNDVLGPVLDRQIAVRVQRRHITGMEPIVGQGLFARAQEITVEDPVSPHHQIALGHAVARQFIAVRVHDLEVHAPGWPPLVLAQGILVFKRQIGMFGQRLVRRAQGRHLRHAPGVDQLNPVSIAERGDHRGRTGRPAHDRALEALQLRPAGLCRTQKAEPNGRHAKGNIDAICVDQSDQGRAIQPRPRQHHPRADHRAGIRRAPGVYMKHRHHRQHHVAR